MSRKLMLYLCLGISGLFLLPVITYGQKADTIKIGHLDPYVGPYAAYGGDSEQGMRLCFDEVGWKVAGKKIELINGDTEANPKVALDKLKKLKEYDKIDILTGVTSSAVGLAIWDYIVSNRIPWIQSTACGDDVFSFTKRSKYIYRAMYSLAAEESIVAYGAYDAGYKKGIIGAADYAGGYATAKVFKTAFKEKGGEIVQEFYPPLGTADYSPYLTSLKVREGDFVWVFLAGADGARFITQYRQYGLEKTPLFTSSHAIAAEVLPSVGDAALGVIGSSHWFPSLDTPENKKFVMAYKGKFNQDPSLRSFHGYVGARVIVEALKVTKGDVSDLENFLKAVGRVSFQTPNGRFEFEPETNTVIQDYYLVKVVKKDSGLDYEILKKYPRGKAGPWGPKLYP